MPCTKRTAFYAHHQNKRFKIGIERVSDQRIQQKKRFEYFWKRLLKPMFIEYFHVSRLLSKLKNKSHKLKSLLFFVVASADDHFICIQTNRLHLFSSWSFLWLSFPFMFMPFLCLFNTRHATFSRLCADVVVVVVVIGEKRLKYLWSSWNYFFVCAHNKYVYRLIFCMPHSWSNNNTHKKRQPLHFRFDVYCLCNVETTEKSGNILTGHRLYANYDCVIFPILLSFAIR